MVKWMTDRIITLSHGAGGAAMAELIDTIFRSRFANPLLNTRDDSAILDGNLALTTDSYVVDPLFFPGGDIGRLAICGTVNDLACVGATPIGISASFILEEGLSFDILEQIAASMQQTADEVGVSIITGDTKVVPSGAADKLFITTTGVGQLRKREDGSIYHISGSAAKPGDIVIITGTLGDHGMAVMSRREGLEFESEIISDVAPLAKMVSDLLDACPDVHVLRDPTRGGLASTLNEIAAQSNVAIEIDEASIPVNEPVRAACELLGIDPLYVANEGKMVVVVPSAESDAALQTIKQNKYGTGAVTIGRVLDAPAGRVMLKMPFGNRRIVSLHHGEILPRIC